METYSNFKKCCILSALFSQDADCVMVLFIFVQVLFFTNDALKYKYKFGHLKVKEEGTVFVQNVGS
jgi:hypothetical protein